MILRIYSVLIGKISTRKHKQWDSDGLLQVDGNAAVLKVNYIVWLL